MTAGLPRRALVLVAVVASVVLAACSGGGEPTPTGRSGVSTAVPTRTEAAGSTPAAATPTPTRSPADELRARGAFLAFAALRPANLPEGFQGFEPTVLLPEDIADEDVAAVLSILGPCGLAEEDYPMPRYSASSVFAMPVEDHVALVTLSLAEYDSPEVLAGVFDDQALLISDEVVRCIAEQTAAELTTEVAAAFPGGSVTVTEASAVVRTGLPPDVQGVDLVMGFSFVGTGIPDLTQTTGSVVWTEGPVLAMLQVLQRTDLALPDLDPVQLHEVVARQLAEALEVAR